MPPSDGSLKYKFLNCFWNFGHSNPRLTPIGISFVKREFRSVIEVNGSLRPASVTP